MTSMLYHMEFFQSVFPLQDDTWVMLSGLEHASTLDRYITAIYWSMSTLCTVGYPCVRRCAW
jgi:hypothetical protein